MVLKSGRAGDLSSNMTRSFLTLSCILIIPVSQRNTKVDAGNEMDIAVCRIFVTEAGFKVDCLCVTRSEFYSFSLTKSVFERGCFQG